jgi:cell division septal protein FtsQ
MLSSELVACEKQDEQRESIATELEYSLQMIQPTMTTTMMMIVRMRMMMMMLLLLLLLVVVVVLKSAKMKNVNGDQSA